MAEKNQKKHSTHLNVTPNLKVTFYQGTISAASFITKLLLHSFLFMLRVASVRQLDQKLNFSFFAMLLLFKKKTTTLFCCGCLFLFSFFFFSSIGMFNSSLNYIMIICIE